MSCLLELVTCGEQDLGDKVGDEQSVRHTPVSPTSTVWLPFPGEASVLTWDSHCYWKGVATCSRMAMICVKEM